MTVDNEVSSSSLIILNTFQELLHAQSTNLSEKPEHLNSVEVSCLNRTANLPHEEQQTTYLLNNQEKAILVGIQLSTYNDLGFLFAF